MGLNRLKSIADLIDEVGQDDRPNISPEIRLELQTSFRVEE
jgi:hypothetical protein